MNDTFTSTTLIKGVDVTTIVEIGMCIIIIIS